ncbi:MAG: hicd [Gammaproteobacteria bacterium]|nr:hicd [Gammaproteobacteria bacterium]
MSIITVKRIGFLATGSELTTGEILNTNVQAMAQALLEHGAEIGEHVIVDDRESNILSGLEYLFKQHDAVIVSGGLGPTSDDRTRFAISSFCKQALDFNEASWQRIVERLSKRNIPIPENNRQQALFPTNATVFPNINGTADGCFISCHNKLIFMLPGPPRECLPLFDQYVMPILEKHNFFSPRKLYRWRLMGASESAIAEQLEEIGKPFNLEFAYRAAYPYVDIKLMLEQNEQLPEILAAINTVVAPYLVTTTNSPISSILQASLHNFDGQIGFLDLASKGQILSRLLSPSTHSKIMSVDKPCHNHCVVITGLEQYWYPKPSDTSTVIELELIHNGKSNKASKQIYLRGSETMDYAMEFTCFEIYRNWFI